jgi:hypothetical protein
MGSGGERSKRRSDAIDPSILFRDWARIALRPSIEQSAPTNDHRVTLAQAPGPQ